MKFYSILEGNTQDVLRRLLRLINKSVGRIGVVEADIDDLEDKLALKATKAELKTVTDLIGDTTSPAEGTILARLAALEAAESETQGETPGESTSP